MEVEHLQKIDFDCVTKNIFSINFIMQTTGTRAQVWHGTAKKTPGGLTKSNLMKNKHGRIVSKRKHASGKKTIKHLRKLGYVAKKGEFKLFHKGHKGHKSRKMRGGTTMGMPTSGSTMPTSGSTNGPSMPKMAAAMATGGKMKGGMAYGGPLSPHSYDGKGVGTSGVYLQTGVAGTH